MFQELRFSCFLSRTLSPIRSHLAVAQHDYPHQHHIDFCSQRIVMVDLVHLESQKQTQKAKLTLKEMHKLLKYWESIFCQDNV